MKDPLIHIGYHKTASTWLQKEIFNSDKNIFENLTLKQKKCSLAKHFIFNEETKEVLSPFSSNYFSIINHLDEIRETNKIKGDKPLVISSERLSGNPHSSGFDSRLIADRLYKVFPNAKVLIIIREQKTFILSNYLQYLDKGGTKSINEYLNTPFDGKRPGFSYHFIEYVPLIKYYHQLFGEENVRVLPYEMFKEKGKDFIENISIFSNTKIKIEVSKFDVVWNKKQHLFLYYYLRFLGGFVKKSSLNNFSPIYSSSFNSLQKRIYSILGKIFFDRLDFNLKRKIKNKISGFVKDRFETSNKELSQLINIDLSKYKYF